MDNIVAVLNDTEVFTSKQIIAWYVNIASIIAMIIWKFSITLSCWSPKPATTITQSTVRMETQRPSHWVAWWGLALAPLPCGLPVGHSYPPIQVVVICSPT